MHAQLSERASRPVTRVERAIEIDAPAARVFEFVAAEWETDLAFLEGRRCAWRPEPPGRLRSGFRASFRGELLALRGRQEVTVREFVELAGWTACSAATPQLTWSWQFTGSRGRCRAAQVCEYRPRGLWDRLMERCVGRRRRADAVATSLVRLKALVERQASLERLRGAGRCRP